MNPDLLSQLRDIHTAPEVPWWPPAPGWWVLALLVLLMLTWLLRKGFVAYRVRKRREQMLAWIDRLESRVDAQQQPHLYLATLNQVFKLVALQAFPEQHCAAMTGRQWVEFLRAQIGDSDAADSLAVLATGPYEPAPRFDAGSVSSAARLWIRKHG